MPLLEVNKLSKTYVTRFGSVRIEALKDVTFTIEDGEYIAIMGESGSGKTTLLNLIATLDRPTTGEILLRGENMTRIRESNLAKFRREKLGFVFQDFNLLDTFNVRDNIFLPMVLSGVHHKEMNERLIPIAAKLGISDLLEKYPYEISGGQKQRVAVARALVNRPGILLADEPTGALDSKSSDQLLRIFSDINADKQTILMVTHSARAASRASRVIFIRDGELYHQLFRGNLSDDEMYHRISETWTVLSTGGDRA